MNRAWYELDYMLTTTDMIKRLQNARVQPYTFSDHMAKVLCFHLCPASKRQWAGQKFHTAARYKQPPTTDYTAMRGPTPAARQIRSHMQQEMEQRLQPWLPHMHIAPQPHLPTITIFVDGSFTGPPGTSPQHHKAGWGIHIPQHNISFCDRVTTDSTHPRWVGATHLSNNTGELTAITFALMWTYFHITNHNICIAYDSTCAANCTQGYWAPNNNQSLVEQAQHWLRLCQEKHMYLSDTCQPTHNKRIISQTRRRRNQPH
jgi:ribonuclease HI